MISIPRTSSLLALSVAALLIAGCGESEEEKAKAQVCHSREQIMKSISSLQTLPISTSAINTAKQDLSNIDTELGKIKEAEPKLEPSIKGEIESAQSKFKAEVTAVTITAAKELASTGSANVEKLGPQLKQALERVVNSYKSTIGNIKC